MDCCLLLNNALTMAPFMCAKYMCGRYCGVKLLHWGASTMFKCRGCCCCCQCCGGLCPQPFHNSITGVEPRDSPPALYVLNHHLDNLIDVVGALLLSDKSVIIMQDPYARFFVGNCAMNSDKKSCTYGSLLKSRMKSAHEKGYNLVAFGTVMNQKFLQKDGKDTKELNIMPSLVNIHKRRQEPPFAHGVFKYAHALGIPIVPVAIDAIDARHRVGNKIDFRMSVGKRMDPKDYVDHLRIRTETTKFICERLIEWDTAYPL